MILDTIENLPLYEGLIPGARGILAAFSADDPAALPIEVREKRYALKQDAQRRFEAHFHTIDLMIAQEGAEFLHIAPMDRLTPAEALPAPADGRKLDGVPCGSAVLLEKGYFCAIFPGEAHMVAGKGPGAEESVAKWVVKVPAPEGFRLQG